MRPASPDIGVARPTLVRRTVVVSVPVGRIRSAFRVALALLVASFAPASAEDEPEAARRLEFMQAAVRSLEPEASELKSKAALAEPFADLGAHHPVPADRPGRVLEADHEHAQGRLLATLHLSRRWSNLFRHPLPGRDTAEPY